jgi:hypothetical protein
LLEVDSQRCTVDFAEPQWAVTPGQSVVIYESRVCLGGGIIEAGQTRETPVEAEIGCPTGTIEADDRR